ncbi:hypothetical protein IKJ53_06290, partial [bacterium]|nr:hypothetical protein [bacterium]
MRKKLSKYLSKILMSATAVGLLSSCAIASSDFYTIDVDPRLYSEGRYMSKAYSVSLNSGAVYGTYGTGATKTYYYIADSSTWRADNPPAETSTAYSVVFTPDDNTYSVITNTDSIITSVDSSSIKERVNVQTATLGELYGAFLSGNLEVTQDDGLGYSTVYVGTNGRIEDLSATFVSNNVTSSRTNLDGPFIQVISATIGAMSTDFVGNRVTFSGAKLSGGLVSVYNQSGIDSIVNSTFHTNYIVSSSGEVFGGMISNQGNIATIENSGFIGNIIETAQNVNGGIIYSAGNVGSIKNVEFINNKVNVTGSGNVYGGVIYNEGSMDIVDTSFVGNVITVTGAGIVQGGAIYTRSNLSITAKDKDVVFADNKVIVNSVTKYDDIYVGDSSASVSLDAKEGRTILFNGNINGVAGYGLDLAGTGSIAFWGDITGARFNVEDSSSLTLDFANNEMHTYTLEVMNSNANAKYYIDIDFSSNKSDRFIVSQGGGVVYIDGLNVLGKLPEYTTTIQVIDQVTQGSNVALDINPAILEQYRNDGDVVYTKGVWTTVLSDNVYWSDVLEAYQYSYTYVSSLELAKVSSSVFNALKYSYEENIDESSKQYVVYDILKEYNQLDDSNIPVKNFIAPNSSARYLVSEDLGATKRQLNVKGVLSNAGNVESIIDANGHTLFNVDNGAILRLENVKLSNLVNSTGSALNVGEGGNVVLLNSVIGDVLTSSNSTSLVVNNSDNFVIGTLAGNPSNTTVLNSNVDGFGKMFITEGATSSVGNYVNVNQSLIDVSGALTAEKTSVLNANINLHSGATADLYTGSVRQDIINSGILNFYGYENKSYAYQNPLSVKVSGVGTTNFVSGVSALTGKLQTPINIFENASLYANIEDLYNDDGSKNPISLKNGAKLYLTSINTDSFNLDFSTVGNSDYVDIYLYGNFKTIDASFTFDTSYRPRLTLQSGVNVTNNVVLNNTSIYIKQDASLTTDWSLINLYATGSQGSIYNYSVLNLTGGTEDNFAKERNVGNIYSLGIINIGSESTPAFIYFNQEQVSSYKMENMVNIFEGSKLNVFASYLKNTVTNQGTLILRGGAVDFDVLGNGITEIAGSVTGNTAIENEINILSGGSYIVNANNIANSITIDAGGYLYATGGTLTQDVYGDGVLDFSKYKNANFLYVDRGVKIYAPMVSATGAEGIYAYEADSIQNNVSGTLATEGGYLTKNVSYYLYLKGDGLLFLHPDAKVTSLAISNSGTVFLSPSQTSHVGTLMGSLYLCDGALGGSFANSFSQSSDSASINVIGNLKTGSATRSYAPLYILAKDTEVPWGDTMYDWADFVYESGGKVYTSNTGSVTAKMEQFVRNIYNYGNLYASGILKKEEGRDAVVYGEGTTYINGSLNFENGALGGSFANGFSHSSDSASINVIGNFKT